MNIIYDPLLKEVRTKDNAIDLGSSFLGQYSATTSYTVGVTISYNGLLYVCIQNGTGQQPDSVSSLYWNEITHQGAVGPQGPQGEQGVDGSSLATAFGGEEVCFSSDPDTGLARTSENALALKTGGINALTIDLNQSALFTKDLTITGNLTVNGDTVVQNVATVEIEDNLLVINHGELGAGVAAGQAGLEVDRGASVRYQLLFREMDDAFVVGEVGTLQVVATREDSPTPNGLAFWNDSESRFDTSSTLIFDSDTGNLSADLFFGTRIMQNANDTLIIGTEAGAALSGDANSIIIGVGTAANATDLADCIFVGNGAVGTGAATGNRNVAIGSEALNSLTSASDNIAIGSGAGSSLSSGGMSVLIGTSTNINGGITSHSNVAVGYNAAGNATNRCVILGAYAGRYGVTGELNVFAGYQAGQHVTGAKNVIVGGVSASKVGEQSTNNSVYVGHNVLGDANCSQPYNVVIGAGAGLTLSSGAGRNVIIGPDAGATLTTAANKLVVANSSSETLIHGEFDNKNVGFNSAEYGGGSGVLSLANVVTAPASNPTAGGLLYFDDGVLTIRTPSGLFTVDVTAV
ncbi:MAG: hypothetical protein HQL67_10620 [Magnetococcales bacterium]|nr:hypothetical protein [Magnetococcales bacterium]